MVYSSSLAMTNNWIRKPIMWENYHTFGLKYKGYLFFLSVKKRSKIKKTLTVKIILQWWIFQPLCLRQWQLFLRVLWQNLHFLIHFFHNLCKKLSTLKLDALTHLLSPMACGQGKTSQFHGHNSRNCDDAVVQHGTVGSRRIGNKKNKPETSINNCL